MSVKNILTYIAYETLPSSFLNTIRAARRYYHSQKKRGARNKKVIDRLLQSREPILLELGATRKMKGWTTIDLSKDSDISMDLHRPIPFPDDCVTQIYSSHLLEHFYYPDLVDLLSECYRILKPGGLFKVAVPNAKIYLEAYFNPAGFDAERYCRYKPAFHYISRIDYINYIAYMGGHHRYMFDEENLVMILANAGFKCVRLREFDPSLDKEKYRYQTIYAEGIA